MNTGQTLLTTLAVVLLGTTVLTLNKTFLQHGTILRQTEIGLYAVSLATSVIEEASGQAFDENTIDDVITSPSSLTSASHLKAESGETYPVLDDFDDYNGLQLGYKAAGTDSFSIRPIVYYVNSSAPNTPVSSPTFFKRMDVSVWGTATGDTVKMSYIFSYFIFR